MTDASVKRKRSRIACEPCRERKRKCNGESPCDTCSQFDYQCYFDLHQRKKRVNRLPPPVLPDCNPHVSSPSTSVDPTTASPIITSTVLPSSTATSHSNLLSAATSHSDIRSTTTSHSYLRSIQANSGAAFMRKLVLRLDPVNAPNLSLFAWNLGSRGQHPDLPRPLTQILTKSDMQHLATVYLEKPHVVYGFIDRNQLYRSLDPAWRMDSSDPEPTEAVLCGVAALALLFKSRQPDPRELELAKRASILLEQTAVAFAPSVDTAIAHMLRVIYLRLTATPHSAWMASCTCMHIIEAAGLHTEPSPDSVLHRAVGAEANPEVRRRLFGVAQHLNIWISFDLGRSRVALRGTSSLPPTARPEDITTQLLDYLPLSQTLDPDRSPDSSELELLLASVLDSDSQNSVSCLTRCNLILCIYRRLRALNHNISGLLLDRLVDTCARGIESAGDLLRNELPWHHVAYSPFQILCTLLIIDTRSSLGHIEAAMDTLSAVVAVYNTPSMKEAYSAARLLILLHQKRKEEDARILDGVLTAIDHSQLSPIDGSPSCSVSQRDRHASPSYSWLDDLTTDMPGLQDIDWEQFFSQDTSWAALTSSNGG